MDIEKIKEIESEIQDLPTTESYVVSDGIINPDKYNEAEFRIMWVLKEPFSDGKDTGNWSITKILNGVDKWNQKGGAKTYKNIVLTTYGILNNQDLISTDMYQRDKWQEKYEYIKNIAYINTKKNLGKSSSLSRRIRKAYKNNQELLHKQLDVYNPDIIIFGNTFSFFKRKLQEKDLQKGNKWKWKHLNFKNRGYYIQNNKLYIDTYHPELRGLKESDKISYLNTIIEAVRELKKLRKLN